MPGVILLDRAILLAEQLLARPGAGWQVGNAKFLAAVGPEETLTYAFQPGRNGGLTFSVRAGGREFASGDLTPAP